MRVNGNTVTEEDCILVTESNVSTMCVSDLTATYMC